MGVYIRGMEMPKSCCACYLKMNCDDCEGYECVCLPLRTEIGYLDDLLTDKRHDDCPLVPVQPHERLIEEADAIETAWMILRGLGYFKEENPQLEQTVREVFATAPAIEVK